MKRAVVLVVTLLVLALVGTLFFSFVEANFLVPPPPPSLAVQVQLPESRVYGEESITVAFSIQRSYQYSAEGFHGTFYMIGEPDEYRYFLDGKEMILDVNEVSADSDFFLCKASLSGLSEGLHKLSFYVHYTYRLKVGPETLTRYNSGFSNVVAFTVDTSKPKITVDSPKAEAYGTRNVALNFCVDKVAARMAYVLDGGKYVDVAGNSTLINLSDGEHRVSVYVWDAGGNVGSSEVVAFSVGRQTQVKPEDQPAESEATPFPTTWTASSIIASVGVVSFGLVAYFLRRKRRS